MKKISILLIAVGTSLTIWAQEGPKFFTGGGIGFENTSVKDKNSTNSFSITPTFAYMFNSKMGAGINFNYNTSTQKWNDSEDKLTTNSWNFEPFFRYYIPASEKFKFFGDAALSFGGGKVIDKDDQGETERKTGNFGVNLLPGAQYWFTTNWSMATSIGRLGYNSTTDNKGGNNESVENNFGFKLDFSTVKFGLYYHF